MGTFDLAHGFGLFFIGMTVSFVGFFIAFLIINYNFKKQYKNNNRKKGPLDDLYKFMPGWKGDDCQ